MYFYPLKITTFNQSYNFGIISHHFLDDKTWGVAVVVSAVGTKDRGVRTLFRR
jgi:hypothetical protein